MRALIAVSVATLFLTACASQATPPAKPAAAPAPTVAAAPKAPQCWNGDNSKFEAVGVKTKIAGVEVVCKPTSDGKNAQWMGAGH